MSKIEMSKGRKADLVLKGLNCERRPVLSLALYLCFMQYAVREHEQHHSTLWRLAWVIEADSTNDPTPAVKRVSTDNVGPSLGSPQSSPPVQIRPNGVNDVDQVCHHLHMGTDV